MSISISDLFNLMMLKASHSMYYERSTMPLNFKPLAS